MMRRFLLPLLFLPFISCTKMEVIQKPLIISKTLNLKVEYNKPILIDINNDQVNDYIFSTALIQHNSRSYTYFTINSTTLGQQRNKVLIMPTDDTPSEGWAVAHENGIEISPTLSSGQITWNFTKGFLMGFSENETIKDFEGSFANKGEKYIGIMFTLNQKNYFGWVKISHNNNNQYIEIKECAYNALPERSIKAGQKK